MNAITLKTCPVCGSKRIRQVMRDIASRRGGTPYVAREIEVDECPNCGEVLFSPEALKRISAQRPKVRQSASRAKRDRKLRSPQGAKSAG